MEREMWNHVNSTKEKNCMHKRKYYSQKIKVKENKENKEKKNVQTI